VSGRRGNSAVDDDVGIGLQEEILILRAGRSPAGQRAANSDAVADQAEVSQGAFPGIHTCSQRCSGIRAADDDRRRTDIIHDGLRNGQRAAAAGAAEADRGAYAGRFKGYSAASSNGGAEGRGGIGFEREVIGTHRLRAGDGDAALADQG